MSTNPLEYYRDRKVAEEIAAFLKSRWAAIEGRERKWVRWLENRPLTISDPSDVHYYVRRYYWIGARTFYGTIEVFKRLEERSDVEEEYAKNVVAATPFIDIDVVDEKALEKAWHYVVKAASAIVEELRQLGIEKSVYLVWSGAGMHVRVSEKAFSNILREAHPIDVAFALVEYVLRRLGNKLRKIVAESKGFIKIENLVAAKRVFTVPLSLHRRLDRVAVALMPDDLPDFNLEWSDPENYVHRFRVWERAVEGEADETAAEALKVIGRARVGVSPVKATRIEDVLALIPKSGREKRVELHEREVREPGRFQVMALLQAARYYLLTGDLDAAKSWGLNRAIFYAWAKYYGPHSRSTRAAARRYSVSGARVSENEVKWVEVGGEKAMVSPRGFFVIGGVEQTPEDFDRYVVAKFREAGIDFEEAWKAALEYLKKLPRSVLRDPQRFFKEVYEPVRDSFVEKVLRARKTGSVSGLERWLKRG